MTDRCTYCAETGEPCICAYLAEKDAAGEPYDLRALWGDRYQIERDAAELARIRDEARERREMRQ